VGNNGGLRSSDPCVLTVVNSLPVVSTLATNTPQNVPLTIPVGDMLAVASDPEGKTLSVLAVSGVPPVTYSANFDDGQVPANATVTGVAGGGYVAAADGVGGTGCLKLTDSVASRRWRGWHRLLETDRLGGQPGRRHGHQRVDSE
jgi:hypothetical protein